MSPFDFQWYVSVEKFDLFGKLRVIPIVRPGNLEVGGEVIGFSFPARVQDSVRSGLIIIITPELIRPCCWGFSFIPRWNNVYPLIVSM